METDAAQDQPLCFPKILATAVDLFCLLDLVVLLHRENLASLSAFNPVESRIVLLSYDFSGIVLPYDHFGNHLDSFGETIDREMVEKHFQKIAEVLSEVWEKTVIDGHSVNCRAVPVVTVYINQQLLTVCSMQNIVNNLDIFYKL